MLTLLFSISLAFRLFVGLGRTFAALGAGGFGGGLRTAFRRRLTFGLAVAFCVIHALGLGGQRGLDIACGRRLAEILLRPTILAAPA